MPSPEYGHPVRHLSTRLVHVISEAFIYGLFIASLWIIHLNESARNMNAMARDRMTPHLFSLACTTKDSAPVRPPTWREVGVKRRGAIAFEPVARC
jgi:hypothetical protein